MEDENNFDEFSFDFDDFLQKSISRNWTIFGVKVFNSKIDQYT